MKRPLIQKSKFANSPWFAMGLVAFGFCVLILHPSLAGGQNFDVSAGIGAVDEGDDRLRPAVSLRLGYDDEYLGRLFYYGASYGPVEQHIFNLAAAYQFGFFQLKTVKTAMGLVILREQTVLSYQKEEDKAFAQNDERYNFGMFLGVYWQPLTRGPLYLDLAWESAVYPAGDAVIFLATGRKQFLTVTAGIKL